MLNWLKVAYWEKTAALLRQRERLAFLLWPFLPELQRREDNSQPLWLVARMVRAIERGCDDFPEDGAADALWDQARTNQGIQQAINDLRTLRRQLEGDHVAQATPVAPFTRQQLKPLKARINADQIDGLIGLHAELLVPLLSALFLFSGWMFNSIFFSHFGVPVGRYYGLSDYLAASFDGLIGGVLTLLVSLIYQWFVRNRIRLQVLQSRVGGWRNVASRMLVLVVAVLLVTVMPRSQDPAERQLVSMLLKLLGLWTVALEIFVIYSRRPARDRLLLSFATIYLAVIWFNAELRYLTLEERVKLSEITLVAAPDKPLLSRIVSGNSLYLFLMNEQRELVAVPIEQVLSVRYLRTEAGPAAERQEP